MKSNFSLYDPYLILYAFFDGSSETNKEAALSWRHRLATRLEVSTTDNDSYISVGESHRRVCHYVQEDALVVYASVDIGGLQDSSVWQLLADMLLIPGWRDRPQEQTCWGYSLIFGAQINQLPPDNESTEFLNKIPLPLLDDELRPYPLYSPQPWGHLWQLAWRMKPGRPQVYAVFTTAEQEPLSHKVLTPRNSIDFLELSLHKAYHQIELYHRHRPEGSRLIRRLDTSLHDLLRDMSAGRPLERAKLADLSRCYVELISDWTTRISELQNTVEVNLSNYRHSLNEISSRNENDRLFSTHTKRMQQGIAQMITEKGYCDAAIERLSTGLEAIRSDTELSMLEQGQQEARRENRRDFLLALIASVLSLTQLWPIFQEVMDLDKWSDSAQLYANSLALILIVLLALIIFGLWHKKRR